MRVTTKSVGNVIVTETETKDTTLNAPVKLKEVFHYEKQEVPVCDKVHRTGLDYFCRYWTLGTCVIMLLAAIILAVRKLILKR